MEKSIILYLDKEPKENLLVKETTTILEIKSYLSKYGDTQISFFPDKRHEVKVFDTNKYDSLTLKSVWDKMKDSYIILTSKTKLIPSTQCLKIASLRKEYSDKDINLEKWMKQPNNLYVGRKGRIFITQKDGSKKIFHYPGSKWGNPYKVGDYTLKESLDLYRKHVLTSGLDKDLEELKGKTLGCFCDQKKDCHAKVLVELYKILLRN